MAAIDDLNAKVTSLMTSVSAELAAVTAALAAAQGTGGNDAAIETAVGQLNTLQESIDAETAKLAPAPPAA